ncbi:hypothetical protein [Saccharomonospora azurea]|uniref:Uncharacterized protein n=1 Tax=Saccharomonospora azurea NA-128 TaxID=882081 RepID=H8G991_9PSEU|nr:hypothetical protein [Saccharomonospora azurea]EHY87476.1 hypothetical protein SacazDRAFT_00516 [Saccharomonospora azurea NA-128]
MDKLRKNSGDRTSGDNQPVAGPPRWVKVFGLIALLVVVLLAVLLIFGGEHGPSRHFSLGDPADHAVSETVLG